MATLAIDVKVSEVPDVLFSPLGVRVGYYSAVTSVSALSNLLRVGVWLRVQDPWMQSDVALLWSAIAMSESGQRSDVTVHTETATKVQ